MDKDMNIALLGGLGYISSHTAIEFLEYFKKTKSNTKLILVDNLSNSSYLTYLQITRITNSFNVIFYEKDINENIDDIFEKHDIDTVIHFAGYKAVAESIMDPLKYYSNNVGGLLNVLRTMNKYHVSKLIFSSSACVYGPNRFSGENSPTCPTNPYGQTKLISEQMLKDCSRAYNMKVICLRYYNPVSCHSSGLIGENSKQANNLFPVIYSVLKGEREFLSVYGNDYDTRDKYAIRDFIHVKDLSQAHVCAYKYFDKMNTCFEIFNVGCSKGYSVMEIIEEFFKQLKPLKKELPYKICARREGDAAEVVANCEKAVNVLGFKAKLTLQDMVEDSLNYLFSEK